MLGKDYEGQDCSLARSLESIGERWTLLIVRDAFWGVRRFNDFQTQLDIPKGVLSVRLNGLVEDGVMRRLPDPSHRGRHLYELTAAGRDLWPVVHSLLVWGDQHVERNSLVFSHAVCGTLLDGSGACPECGVRPEPEDVMRSPARGRRRSRTPRADPVTEALRTPARLLEPLEVTSG